MQVVMGTDLSVYGPGVFPFKAPENAIFIGGEWDMGQLKIAWYQGDDDPNIEQYADWRLHYGTMDDLAGLATNNLVDKRIVKLGQWTTDQDAQLGGTRWVRTFYALVQPLFENRNLAMTISRDTIEKIEKIQKEQDS